MITLLAPECKGRKIKHTELIDVPGEFQSMWAAQTWLKQNGYSYGSSCREMPIAVCKGEYNLPQKWKNFTKAEKKTVDGILITSFREGPATVIIFEE